MDSPDRKEKKEEGKPVENTRSNRCIRKTRQAAASLSRKMSKTDSTSKNILEGRPWHRVETEEHFPTRVFLQQSMYRQTPDERKVERPLKRRKRVRSTFLTNKQPFQGLDGPKFLFSPRGLLLLLLLLSAQVSPRFIRDRSHPPNSNRKIPHSRKER